MGQVRTRVAPSPTGFPHVGTAFQALLDWAYARRYDGQFLMRIEDTDQKRFVPGAEKALEAAMRWLELVPDESPFVGGDYGPYRQSERLGLYRQYAQQLVDQDQAYYCFCSQERLAEVRQKQQKQGIPPKYDRHCLNLTKREVEQKLAQGEKAVVRLKVPDDQTIVVQDLLRGKVEFDSNTVDDQVLLKSDGFPTYHLAVVVDDHLMKVSHVVRGEEWLPSAPKHVLLYQYFAWPMPILIHTPTLRNSDKSKLSKRKGNTALWWYREHGYLPAALLNFLGLLVWKPAENQEKFTKQEMIDKFEWREMNITGPVFDLKKLNWLNGKYLRELTLEELLANLQQWADWVLARGEDSIVVNQVKKLKKWQAAEPELFMQAVSLARDRARTLAELPELLEFYFADRLEYDQADLLQKSDPQQIKAVLQAVKERLQELVATDNYSAETWEQAIRNTADKQGLAHKTVFMSLRSAITAQKFTPPLYEVMEVLGPDTSFARIDQALNSL